MLLFQCYQKWVFNFSKLLEPFILSADVDAFRQILQTSGGVISGAAALQFLDRMTFGNASELDIYVLYQNLLLITEWFHCHGFNESVPYHTTIDVVSIYQESSEIKDVTNFTVVDSIQVMQLISMMRDLVFTVLDFHSSVLLCLFFPIGLC